MFFAGFFFGPSTTITNPYQQNPLLLLEPSTTITNRHQQNPLLFCLPFMPQKFLPVKTQPLRHTAQKYDPYNRTMRDHMSLESNRWQPMRSYLCRQKIRVVLCNIILILCFRLAI
jgi:hypothetical protein